MKLVILDHFRRWWWVWALGGTLYGVLAIILARGNEPHPQGAFPVGAFLGAFLVAMDVQRGHARSLLALPVRPAQIAKAWWWASVGIPAALLAVLSGIAFGVAYLINPKPPMLFPAVMDWLDNVLLLGVLFFALTGLPAKGYGTGDWKQQVRGVVFGAMWGGCIGGWMLFKYLNILTPLGAGITLTAGILAVVGWYRDERLVMERAGLSPRPSSTGTNAQQSRCAEGKGGMWYLVWTMFSRMVIFGFGMFIAVFLIFALMMQVQKGLSAREFLAGNMVSLFTFQLMWMMSLQFFTYAMHIRCLRALPMSGTTLANILVFVPLVAMTVVYGLSVLLRSAVFQAPLPGLATLVGQGCLLQISSAIIAIPLLVWRGIDLVNYLIGMTIMIGGILATIFSTGTLPLAINLAVPFLLAGVYMTTKKLLERNSRTYRARTYQMMGFNWR